MILKNLYSIVLGNTKRGIILKNPRKKIINTGSFRSIVFQEASNYSIDYGHFDYATYGNAVAFVQEPSVNTIINYVISLGAGKRLWTFTPTNPALPVLEIILDFPTTNTENAPPYKPIWSLEYTTADFGGGHPPFSPNGTQYDITVNPALTCYNSEAEVLMQGWYEPGGDRILTRDNENLYTYYVGGTPGDETLDRTNSSSLWVYRNAGDAIVTSLTVSPFPWQAEWPSPFVSTKLLPSWKGGNIYNIGDIVTLGGFNWICLAYAPAGYGPFGGYLDGTGPANGIIYWQLLP